MKVTAKDILTAVHRKYPASTWLVVDELRLPGANGDQRIDALAMCYWPSSGHVRATFEIKVSRRDFLAELKAPEKRQWALRIGHHFWFALADGIADPEEVPPEAGVMVYRDGELVTVREAPSRQVAPADETLMLAVARRAASSGRRAAAAETGIAGWHWIEQLVRRALLDVQSGVDAVSAGTNLGQALRAAGHVEHARTVEGLVRDGKKTVQQRWEDAMAELRQRVSTEQHANPE